MEQKSAIPRISRLPQPRPAVTASVLDLEDANSSINATATSVSSRPLRHSMILPKTSAATDRVYPLSPRKKRQSVLLEDGVQGSDGVPWAVSSANLDGILLKSIAAEESPQRSSDSISPRKSRPSLSDRTVETLSQIPPSPSPRRKSGFFTIESPMQPPPRAASAMSHSRSGSRVGIPSLTMYRKLERPPSPIKRTTTTQGDFIASRSPVKKAVGVERQGIGFVTDVSRGTGLTGLRPQSKLKQPGVAPVQSPERRFSQRPAVASRSVAPKYSRAEPPMRGSLDTFRPLSPTKASIDGKQTLQYGSPSRTRLPEKGLTHAPLRRAVKSPDQLHVLSDVPEQPKASSSSQTLRDTIAKAKAARKSGVNGSPVANVPRSLKDNDLAAFHASIDPASFSLTESIGTNSLRKRINNAKAAGKLDIAGLGLTELPEQVLRMYDYDPNDTETIPWYESVEIVRLLAGDNEIAELRADAFPSESPESFESISEDSISSLFSGLEVVDFHGNQLKSLPTGLGRLYRLTSLNLSKNLLSNDALNVISGVISLKELRLAENRLSGPLPENVCDLQSLEFLDLSGNAISEISSSIGKLSNLKILNVATNRLSSLPFEAIFDLPITEINASRNRLDGSLFPQSVNQFFTLKILDVTNNALISLSEGSIAFPVLESIALSNNRISALPDVSEWPQLVTLNADENKISAIPDGFTKLKHLKSVDLSNNSLLYVDSEIGLMESLIALRIMNNPIRERRLMKINTVELKAELRERLSPGSPTSERSGTGGILSPSFRRSSGWEVQAGTVDKSNCKLQSIEKSDLEPLAVEDVKTLVLHHNQLQSIPSILGILGSTLTSIDLSYNKIGKSGVFLIEPIDLPNLQTLNLTSNALTSLDPLMQYLSAPRLVTLILLFNRITSLPHLCEKFPALLKLLASNNAITSLDVDGLRGLQVLDVSSNEIDRLPPRLALLQGQLRTLMVGGNRFRVPSWGVLEKGTEEILKWCRRMLPPDEGNVGNNFDTVVDDGL